MKKVLFVIAGLYGGGAERVLSNLVINFPEDWEIDILLNNNRIEFPYKGNILTLSLPDFGERKTIGYFIREVVRRTCYLRKLKKNNNYSACISLLESSNISNILSGNKYCKTIISIHNVMVSKEAKLLYRISAYPLINLLYRHADKIITVSKEIEAQLVQKLKAPKEKTATIVNGCDCLKIQEQIEKLPQNKKGYEYFMNKNHKIVVCVGRIDVQKGQWHLIRAFSEVVKKEPKAMLFLIGIGALEDYLKELIQKYNLEKNVIMLGFCDNPFWYNAHADIFILPSMYEGYPCALAEAVCCGVPCITTDFHSGAREIIAPDLDVTGERVSDISEEKYGILIPVCSGKMYRDNEPLEMEEQKMAEAITMLLGDYEKRQHYKRRSIERSKDLDIKSIVNEWIDLISKR